MSLLRHSADDVEFLWYIKRVDSIDCSIHLEAINIVFLDVSLMVLMTSKSKMKGSEDQ